MAELSAPELQSFHLTYGQLNLQNGKTQCLLQSLLSTAGKMVGFQKGKGKLLVEVYPAPEQGCTIYFTALTPVSKRYRKLPPKVYQFETCEDLLQGAACFGNHAPVSEAYRYKNGYLLIVHNASAHGITEFAKSLPFSSAFLAHVREHGTLLCKPNAVERLQG